MKSCRAFSPKAQRIIQSRRRFLQLTGASAVTMPFLRALPGYAQAEAPTYLALTMKGNGIVRHTWGADKLGEGIGEIQFRPTLAPLAGFESYVTVVNGLKAEAADLAGGTHEGGMASLWTGKAVQQGPGASIDQVLAESATGTPRRSVELRAMSGNDEVVKTPNNRMIFDSAGNAIDPREDAGTAFDQLFAGVMGDEDPTENPDYVRRQLLMSHVDQQLAEVSPKLCNEDKVHLDALRAGWNDLAVSLTQVVQCDPESPASLQAEHALRTQSRQMVELLVMCFACDVTRIGSLQWSQGRSDMIADFLGITTGHHDLSHAQPQAHVFEEYVPWPEDYFVTHVDAPPQQIIDQYSSIWEPLNQIDSFYMEEFAYLLQRLQELPATGGGTLLDQSLIAFSTEIDNGSGHDHWNMPYLLAGGAGGRLNRGTVIDFPLSREQLEQELGGSPEGLRYHNDLLVTIAHLMGHTEVTSMGPSEYNQGPLPGVIV